jgi:hypothetical protein
MTEGFVALMVALIGASAGAMGVLAKWVTDRLDRRPRPGDVEITRRLDRIEANNARRDEHAELIDEALRALLFDKIARLHAETVERGRPVPTEVKTRVEAAFVPYAKLHGNGVGKHYRDEMIEAHAAEGQEP